MPSAALSAILLPSGEADLVSAARAGERLAFERLYRQHVGRVHGLCWRLVADADLAEQLTQDAFVHAWRKLHGFRGDCGFGTWLYRVTVNVVLDWRRAQARRQQWETVLDPVEQMDAAAAHRPTAPARVGDRLDLERAIAALPDGARTVFVLHEIEGYLVKEVADLLQIAEGTVKAQLFRARQLLKEALR
ncbi:MAG TPA: RNA polymerase sigma factor [Candidatus Krumholzibacteria bacterium]|nr:RNA polymerase sigma factor [Candidatus Krumholzibacteria bacterium]HPD71021.1 RNA polymerase sigma factor [Candidatus Krumholzibacteria bacterium]HRY39279.1 RNA polymerase sigma factor [Candidatus Krumholzibacteria bacterium]